MSFMGKAAIVTGAGGGMGRTIVEQLCAQGADILMIDVKEPPEPMPVARLRDCEPVSHVLEQVDKASEAETVQPEGLASGPVPVMIALVAVASMLLHTSTRAV